MKWECKTQEVNASASLSRDNSLRECDVEKGGNKITRKGCKRCTYPDRFCICIASRVNFSSRATWKKRRNYKGNSMGFIQVRMIMGIPVGRVMLKKKLPWS